ncbi:MAG: UDP-N-acetylglucosamine--LPS N-acetylglucosamine transferase [Alphaproteobacteria bacterium]|nr:UDP-N-acetylglucosamine--LPS N-acetylglucosamine transferase [Alphaproteobacteria bacterium]
MSRPKKILAVASSGGHWLQLLRLRPAFEGHRVVFATTQADSRLELADEIVRALPDANRNSKLRLAWLMLCCATLVLWERPDVIISTGAAPGYFVIRLGRLLGVRTLWLESIANAEEYSLSTRLVLPYADLTLTQWPHLARPEGPHYCGSVL